MATPPSITVGTCRMLGLALLTLCLFQLLTPRPVKAHPDAASKSSESVHLQSLNDSAKTFNTSSASSTSLSSSASSSNLSPVHRIRSSTAKRQIIDDLLDEGVSSTHDELLNHGANDHELTIQPANDEQPFGKSLLMTGFSIARLIP